jgi:xanthine dehydrogenase accessory factor
MTSTGVFDVIAHLRRAGRPFAVATVVRTADATSAKAGAEAVVTVGGELIGHLGGACVASAVTRAAAAPLAAGELRLIRVHPAATADTCHDADGVELYKSGCPSGGTGDILIEPYTLPPIVAVLGTSPVAAAIARQARHLGYRLATAVEVDVDAIPITGVALDSATLGPADFTIVAAQGRHDLDALRAALLSPAGWVGMVASRRKAAAITDRLRREGLDEILLARLEAPANHDLGGVDPDEIALSVMARIVQLENRRRRPRPETTADWPVENACVRPPLQLRSSVSPIGA